MTPEPPFIATVTRRDFDWTARYPWPIEAAAKLKADTCTIDGELVVAGEDGISSFDVLHSRCFEDMPSSMDSICSRSTARICGAGR